MKALIALALPVLVCLASFLNPEQQSTPQTDTRRFLVTVDGRTGYIDISGKIAIQPIFESGQEFAEGLAAVRRDGRYGFINVDGAFVIEPAFDYATQFIEGTALVFTDGKPSFIDKQGVALFNSVYKEMMPFEKGWSRVFTFSEKAGIVDKSGKLAIDTVYRHIGEFSAGRAVVYGMEHSEYDEDDKPRKLEAGVIDSTGRMVIAYGKHMRISGPSEGYFTAEVSRGRNHSNEIILGIDGQEIYKMVPPRRNSYTHFNGVVHDGIIRASWKVENPENKKEAEFCEAYMTPHGLVIFKCGGYGSRDFFEKRAFVDFANKYTIIDARGRKVTEDTFDQILGDGFRNGRAFVQKADEWMVIDTAGIQVIGRTFKDIHRASIGSSYIFFGDEGGFPDNPVYGIADSMGDVLLQPVMENFDERGFVNGLLSAYIDEKHVYINGRGEIVWEGDTRQLADNKPMNIDYMNRGYFYALGYDTTSYSYPDHYAHQQQITAVNNFPEGFSLIAMPERKHETPWGVQTLSVFIVNSTSDTTFFNTQDNRLYMQMQAQDKTGKWVDIEYLPSSWCGNSYYGTSLWPDHYWSFAAPVYEGCMKTKFRIKLQVVNQGAKKNSWGNARKEDEHIMYSNEFAGSVNPGQFWRKRRYSPTGIMDPYLE
jgi:hypothetical protein